MKRKCTLVAILALFATYAFAQPSNPHHFFNSYKKLPIPDTLGGAYNAVTGEYEYELRIREGVMQFSDSGQQTVTSGYNQYPFLGPTIVHHKGQNIRMKVVNLSNEVSTIHWHGIHLPAVMDGGPYQAIYPGTTWQPYWTVSDSASTYWYHSHLDIATNGQVTSGLAGMLIVHDSFESSLPIPKEYGVDDIPLIITNRRFDTFNQFVVTATQPPPGDYLYTNGVTRAIDTLSANIIRFRLLNASVARAFNIGLSNNDTFWVMGTDGGLLDSLVPIQRYILGPGERISILVDLRTLSGSTLALMAYNRQLPGNYPGGNLLDTSLNGQTSPAWYSINRNPPHDTLRYDSISYQNFPILTIVVKPTDPGGVTAMPYFTKDNHFIPSPFTYDAIQFVSLDSTHLNIFNPNFAPFNIDSTYFAMGVNNKVIPLGNREIWKIFNRTGPEPHPFHIHDIQFYILGIYDTLNPGVNKVRPEQQGWKDLMLVDSGHTVVFYTQFTDYADPLWPYMYHCHILDHEDAGMMAQFIVVDHGINSVKNTNVLPETAVNLYPNPTSDRLFVEMADKTSSVYYITIYDLVGRSLYMLPKPKMENGLDVSDLKPGEYLLKIYDTKGFTTFKKFIKS